VNAHPLPIRPPRLSRQRRILVYAIGLGVWASGAIWLVLHNFFMRETAFGPSPHPLEFWSRAAHGAFAFGALWLFGLLWAIHVPQAWRSLRRRWSGTLMFGLFLWLAVSGCLLYYAGDEWLLATATLLHWVVGLAAPVLFGVHRFASLESKSAVPATITD
jgi:hypothetical protein